jgi:glycerophosphoryl diester phosphodiesterase
MDHPAGTVEILSNVYRDFRKTWIHLFAFNFLSGLIAFVFLGPIIGWIVGTLIASAGYQVLVNEEILAFFLSVRGAVTLLLILVSAIVTGAANLAGMMIIGAGARLGKSVTIVQAVVLVLRRLPRGLGTAVIQVVAILLFLIPFGAIGALTFQIMTTGHDINYLLAETPPRFWIGVGIGGILLAGVVFLSYFLFTRWIFSLPVIVFEGLQGSGALRRSSHLARRKRMRTVLLGLGWGAVWLVLHILVGTVVDATGDLLFPQLGNHLHLVLPAAAALIGFYVVAELFLLYLGPAVASLLLAGLYVDLRRRENDPLTATAGLDLERATEFPSRRKLSRVAYWLTAALMIAGSTGMGLVMLSRVELNDDVAITAHRGSSLRAPENSLSSIRLAIDEGADYVEIDVQNTADGIVVLTHDRDLRRIAGDERRISGIQWNELQKIDVGSWFSADFSDERIGSLEEAIGIARGRIRLNIELKYYGFDESLAKNVVEVLRRENFFSDVVISSLNTDGLRQVDLLAPDVPIGVIVAEAYGRRKPHLENIDFVSVNRNQVTRTAVRQVHRVDREIHVWTINDPKRMNRYINFGVDNILTDDPALLARVLEKRAEMTDIEKVLLRFKTLLWN